MSEIDKKSMFIPADVNEKEIIPLNLGDGFSCLSTYAQGFFCSGEYYLILEHLYVYDCGDCEDCEDRVNRIHIINFNQIESSLERKLLAIKTPKYEEPVHRSSQLDQFSGKVVHTVRRFSKKDGKKKLAIDVYYIYIADFIKMKKFDKGPVNIKDADLEIVYDADQFNEVTSEMLALRGEQEKTVLLFSACYREYTGEVYDSRSCLDIVHMKGEQIWHVKRVLVDLNEPPEEFRLTKPYSHYSHEGILFYQFTFDEEMVNEIMFIQEYDCNGEYKFSYTIPYKGISSCFQPYGNYIMLYPMVRSVGECQFVRLFKLEEGQIKIVEKMKLLFAGDLSSEDIHYNLKPTFKRFDRQLLPIKELTQDAQKFTTMDLESNEKVTEITDLAGLYFNEYSLNWNIQEVGMTFFYNEEISEYFGGKMFFKVFRSDVMKERLSLKHLARLAVMTNFTEDYLITQNIPSSLFDYLGVKN